MDMEEIRYLLGGTIFARAKAYTDRIQDLNCEVAGNGVRHLSADVRGGGRSLYQTQVWLRENGSFVSASCSCPYNENGEGPCCKHIGALLMRRISLLASMPDSSGIMISRMIRSSSRSCCAACTASRPFGASVT